MVANIDSEYSQFSGSIPVDIKVYQIFDKETGVCYAVTNKGGICVMETANKEEKLINQGEQPTIHFNKG